MDYPRKELLPWQPSTHWRESPLWDTKWAWHHFVFCSHSAKWRWRLQGHSWD